VNPLFTCSSCFLQVEFSSLSCIQVPFTRDYDSIKTALGNTDDKLGDKTCIETALNTVSLMVMEEWGVHNPCQVSIVKENGFKQSK
jgi:hypothetical protein